jgi:hypothetical protein
MDLLVTLILLATLISLFALGNLAMNAVNARRDLEFYETLVRVHAARRQER